MEIEIVENPKHTTYHFGNIADLVGKPIPLVERNSQGDCLCLAPGGLIDVDYRDVKPPARART